MRTGIPILLAAIAAGTFATPSYAADGDTEEEFEFLREGEEAARKKAEEAANEEAFDAFALEDDFDFSAPEAQPQVQAQSHRASLGDHFPARVVEARPGQVVVELPVVLGNAEEIQQDFWLIGEVYVDGEKVGEVRQLVLASALDEHTATAFLKMQAPVSGQSGAVEVRVSQMVDGERRALFSRSADFRIDG